MPLAHEGSLVSGGKNSGLGLPWKSAVLEHEAQKMDPKFHLGVEQRERVCVCVERAGTEVKYVLLYFVSNPGHYTFECKRRPADVRSSVERVLTDDVCDRVGIRHKLEPRNAGIKNARNASRNFCDV